MGWAAPLATSARSIMPLASLQRSKTNILLYICKINREKTQVKVNKNDTFFPKQDQMVRFGDLSKTGKNFKKVVTL